MESAATSQVPPTANAPSDGRLLCTAFCGMMVALTPRGKAVADGIRNLRLDEYQAFIRFLDRSFGFARDVFEDGYPHLYRPTPELCAASFVMEQDGQIVSHVGVYPLEVEIDGVSWPIAGIGGVATLPEARGKGYMTQLLTTQWPSCASRPTLLSWLGGDRQRYNSFGWEIGRASLRADVFTRRSLDRAGVEPVEIQASDPEEALPVVEALQRTLTCRAIRADLAAQLHKPDLGIWTTEGGYALTNGRPWGSISVAELASTSGQEASILRAILDWTGNDEIKWNVPACDEARLVRLMPYTSQWRLSDWEMWRIVDLARVLALAQPALQRRAEAVRDLELAIGMVEHDQTQIATLAVRGGEVTVMPGRHSDAYYEWPVVDAARLLLGGPPVARPQAMPESLWAGLRALLPIPAYLPPLDHV